ncbi:hypothetical protein LGK95_20065 [Clostridium algoriphilum]|uniref:hypothetical protein n=1 Tax=Clostridium algoriphilum TaxID=198347 RepID=UPI001CF2C941|nr:hypothetical protein [Clostridium algoriphilum]MCB2295774.1 hypothetical protein [Clostridium algoriphilum]
MDKWSQKVKEVMTQHSERKSDIETILCNLLNVIRTGSRCTFKILDANKLVWDITIGLKAFTLTNEEIVERQIVKVTDEEGFPIYEHNKENLEVIIKEVILEKIS